MADATATDGMDALLLALARVADRADAEAVWPAESWGLLRATGVLAWGVPIEHGGLAWGLGRYLAGYERLAGACLTTTFLLSQREAAMRRLAEHAPAEMRRAWLPPLARGERFVTVGLSQLTTSRQHTAPALLAVPRPAPGGYQLDGVIPWVTGAAGADALVVGAVVPDGRQVLLLLPREREGVTVGLPLDLCALRGSLTAEVTCRAVELGLAEVIAGPAERVLGAGRGPGGLETSCLALGLAGAAIDFLQAEATGRPELRPVFDRFEQARREVRHQLHQLVAGGEPAAAVALRVRANRLVLQATQTALTASKGAGFVRPHPAQRWARQALFFLVWSCPRPAAEGMLAHLLPDVERAPD